MLDGKRILLVIGGGIAAYKVLELIRRLREQNASLNVVMTRAAKQFVTPLSVASLSGGKVFDDLFSLTDETEIGHIQLSRAADLVVVAPATADLLAKMAQGLADDLAATLLLATDKKILVAPAMNLRMWLHPATQRNVATLQKDGVLFVGPEDGDMACGEYGPGRMSEPAAILAAVASAIEGDTRIALLPGIGRFDKPLAGRRVVVTSGPTHEPIDPVRYIGNRSSGRQGHAIAAAAAKAGADVILVSGPVTLPDPPGVSTLHVETAIEMLAAVEAALPADIFIATAAVADWRVEAAASQKIKKSDTPPQFALAENPDILALVAQRTAGRPRLVVGFAAETDHILAHAREKLQRKHCDLIVANDVGDAMGKDENEITLIAPSGSEPWPKMRKDEIAARLVRHLAQMLKDRPDA
ncbi:bifunctional phosphopantothenoylcysteine decarboxylase/phosphopantothenate--cysteine ligase CoaBC [uncultured Methylovirgula sp.]|uniref:bifunctional phosphopantothenoylcysteine decarboxylase/phosphopantothenate--cysteine ligase CoaBC n=1 Tax=uncultured Methylovirgula sp. TaxID=1285960 RepID=UPI00261F66E5|nr:bifunctional phosphopantothenoylcysteine decarboxylase/phosphopantothenate--cysteine ligase CoaBC [uncultured Methylovirgula sp.]